MSKATENFVEKCKTFWDKAEKTDGGMTIGQLAKIIRKAAPNMQISDQEIASIFLDMDKDSDKILSWEEFQEVFTKKDPKKIQQNELMEAFKNMDKDGSGRLSKAEVRSAYKALGINISDEQLAATLKDADVDGDGNIDFNEFLNVWGSS